MAKDKTNKKGEVSLEAQSVSAQMNTLIPRKLDSIVKINRHQLSLEYEDLYNITDIAMDLPTTNIKHELDDAFLYRRKVNLPTSQSANICLVGFVFEGEREVAWHTSTVTAIDVKNQVIKTRSGSFYRVKNFVEGEGHENLLMHICAVSHQEGWGDYFGISHFFY